MKRNMDLIREIVLKVQEDQYSETMEGYSADQIRYHSKLAIEAGLIEGKVLTDAPVSSQIPAAVIVRCLTWSGHDFADAIALESRWEKAKEFIVSSGKTVTLETIKHSVKLLFQTFQ